MTETPVWKKYNHWPENLSPLSSALLFGFLMLVVAVFIDILIQEEAIWNAVVGNIWVAIGGTLGVYVFYGYLD